VTFPYRKKYSSFWQEALASLAKRLVVVFGEGAALDLVHDVAAQVGWSAELEYLALRLLKPCAPIGKERSA
jgi:hypothetical protein